jgi:glycosyltransferase involved in cell wall biosynthesis
VLGRVVQRVCGIPTHVNLREAGKFVFNSRNTMHRAASVGLLAPDITVVYPGIEERFFESLEPRPWGWRLVYLGRLDRQKGVDTAVEALAHLPAEATLAIWGTGSESYADEMRRVAARIGAADQVRFEGFAGSDHLRSIYDQADVVVFPVRWHEPFGLVPLEAMAMGRPVVSTARGGTAEYVRDGDNALVFEPDSPQELAACVIRLAQDEALRERLRARGRKTAAGFPAERFAERTVQEILRGITPSRA